MSEPGRCPHCNSYDFWQKRNAELQREHEALKVAAKAVVAAWRDLTSRGMDDDVGERIEDLERLVGEDPR